ncbi:MAG: diguanylate cyclase [Gammaproteobacteria bacterium]|nr:diguanylate cyclase [Gammaproteobacteria bacterium]
MSTGHSEINEFHWLMDMVQTIDVGLMVLDRDYRVRLWNGFMENHSGQSAAYVIGNKLFELFPDLPEGWFRRKAESVFMLESRAFTTWEQRPYLLRFKNYRPITGTADFMYQNITLIPLVSPDGSINHVGVILYDVTDIAIGKLALEAANAGLARLSRTDRLTELNNRGYWEECLKAEFARVQRSKHPSTLIMFDIDHFKKVNDTYGHQAGDEVIRVTSRTLRGSIRTTDIAGRYGGEEFTVILVDTNADQGLYLAERIRKKIEAQTVTFEQLEIRFTISLGIAQANPQMADHTQWIQGADMALYQAKHGGRNQAVVFHPEKTD